jgi:hypothetical protein
MSITQSVYIPESHRLTIDIPREIPSGRSILTFTLSPEGKTAPKESRSWRDLYGCCADSPGSVNDFLAECHADKEREFAIERRQEEERKKRA